MRTALEQKQRDAEQTHVYTDVYRVLMAGMAASTSFFAVGVVLALMRPAFVPLSTEWVLSQYHWRIIAHGLYAGDPGAYMLMGTVLLILTPVSRVLVSIYVFLAERDYKYAAITGIVFLMMVLTVVLSRFGLR